MLLEIFYSFLNQLASSISDNPLLQSFIVSDSPRPERDVFGINLMTSLARSYLYFDKTSRWSTCVWSQQVYCKSSRGNPSRCRLRNLVIFWVIRNRKWSRRHSWKINHWQRMLKKVLMNWQIRHCWRINIRQRMLTKVLMNSQILKRHWSQSSVRVWKSFRVSIKDIQNGLNFIVSLKTTLSTIHSEFYKERGK